MDDLIERLRDDFKRSAQNCEIKSKRAMIQERRAAAARIAALEADNARLMGLVKEAGEGLGPFAECVEQIADTEDDEEWAKFRLLIKDYRRAAKALAKIKEAADAE